MPNNLTEKELERGYWFVTHKLRLKKALAVGLIILNVGLWSYVIFGLTTYYLDDKNYRAAMAQLPQNLANYTTYREKNQTFPLDIASQTVLSLGGQRYDLAAEVENLNVDWGIPYLEYRFVWPNGQTEFKSGFIMPGEKKFFFDLNILSDSAPSGASIEFQNIRYQRITGKKNLPPGTEAGFSVKNTLYSPMGADQTQEGKASVSNNVRFEATDNTPYNFWSVSFNIILYQGKKIVGVNTVPATYFLSGETRTVEANWFHALPQVTGVVVEPEVNFMDAKTIMPLKK